MIGNRQPVLEQDPMGITSMDLEPVRGGARSRGRFPGMHTNMGGGGFSFGITTTSAARPRP